MGLVELWVLLRTRRELLSTALIGVLLFAAGWQLGRVTSPFYAAHPIVFTEVEGDSGNGDTTELLELKRQGVAEREAQQARVAGQASGSMASPTTDNGTLGEGTAAGVFVGSRNSNLYHHHTCATADRIKPANQIWWNTVEAAAAAGYSPSKCTQDKLGI